MKIGLLHLSDIHISKNETTINYLIPKIQSTCHFELNEIIKLYIIVTGDIANTGNSAEYDIARLFFEELQKNIKENNSFINSIKFIIVPGNHDCLFEASNPVRDALLLTIKADDVAPEIATACLEVQDNFWNFYSRICGDIPSLKISYQIKDKLSLDTSIIFNCYNTSWMSTKNEADCNKIMPVSSLLSYEKRPNDIIISLFHHPTSWLSPHTQKNNKKIFEDHLLQSSNIVLCGHEHSTSSKKILSLKGNDEFIYLEGGAFKEKSGKSSFKLICFDTVDFSGNSYTFEFRGNDYVQIDNISYKLSHSRNDVNIDNEFFKIITDIIIPIKHPIIEKVTLPDIFVYPDLEPLTDTDDLAARKYKDSFEILKFDDEKIIIEGDSQSGRTSLLYAYYYQLFKKGYFPLYIKGKEIKKQKVKEIIKQCIKQQYRKPFTEKNYIEKEFSKRVLLIDDIDRCDLNATGKQKLLEELKKDFSKVIITTRETNEIHSLTENTKLYSDFKYYRIKPLGYYKRNALIELWLKLGQDENTLKADEIATTIQSTFDTISSLLGEQLIPSYPVFILSLLQSLDNQLKPFNLTETSYAYCYQSLILLSLMRAGVSNNDVGGLINFLTEFAYLLYEKKITSISSEQFRSFYNEYTEKYTFNYSLDDVIEVLLLSNLIKEDEEFYSFSYKYLSYYLSAKKIASFIHEEKGYREIVNLCNNLHMERNANILIFITHHTTNNRLIEELLITSLLPFENRMPITLGKDDPFFAFLTSFISEIKDDIVLHNTNPEEYRAKRLKDIDERKQQETNTTTRNQLTEEDFKDPNIVNITQTLKVIKILGQIVKNQHGVFEKDKLESLIESAYLACFRLINFFSTMLIEARGEIIESFTDKIQDTANKDIIQKRVSDFLFLLGYKMCLTSFANLASSVGTSSLKSIYDSVAEKIGSPAAKLISFTIKTYYDRMNVRELEALMGEYKDNPVAIHIIKARVANHLYNNYVSFDKKQKICSICNMKLIN